MPLLDPLRRILTLWPLINVAIYFKKNLHFDPVESFENQSNSAQATFEPQKEENSNFPIFWPLSIIFFTLKMKMASKIHQKN